MTKSAGKAAKQKAKHAAMVRRKDEEIRALLQDDGMLDDFTVRVCRTVIDRARQGHTIAELLGYLGYRRRIAQPGMEKEACRRVAKALRTNRWGLLDVVQQAQSEAEVRRNDEALTREARSEFYEQVAAATAMIPPNKRGRGSGSRRGRRKDKPAPARMWPGTLV